MVALFEQLIWFIVGASSFIAGGISFRFWRKLPIQPYLYQSLALWSFSVFGWSVWINLTLMTAQIVEMTLISFCLAVIFYMKFFREIFGNYRNYEIMQILSGISFGIISALIFLDPPVVFGDQIILSSLFIGSLFIFVSIFFVIVVDYTIFSLRKIRREKLSPKLSYFSLTIICSMIVESIFVVLFVVGYISIFEAFSIQVVFVILIMILLMKYPYINFLALVNPQLITLIHPSGLTLYSYKFQELNQEVLLSGAMSALNNLFKESFAHQGIERIQFRGKTIYSLYRTEFILVYIDEIYMPFITQVLHELGDQIALKYSENLKTFDGNIEQFKNIEEDLRQFFYFLPQLIR